MKKIIFTSLAMFFLAISCNKDAKIDNTKDKADSLQNTHLGIEDLGKTNEAGKVVFSTNGEVILIFDLLENKGKIKLDGKEIALHQISFTENTYTAEGDNISILAENGDFQDITTECIEGNFPKITITYNGKVTDIANIKTKECPEGYNIIN